MYQKQSMTPKQSMVQSQLLTDSLLEMSSVGFRSSDLMCQMYGVEPRTPFTCREVMLWALNLPLIHQVQHKVRLKSIIFFAQ